MKNKIYSKLFSLLPKKTRLFLRKIKLGCKLAFSKESYLVKIGYVNSMMSFKLTDENKDYIPWMNYSVIDFLKKRLKKDLIVFEYGSGYSTVFFAKRTKEIISIEYDKAWYKKVKDILRNSKNVKVYFEDLSDSYHNSIEKYMEKKACDIVIIDGRERVNCAKFAYDYLSDRGVVVFDDSHRLSYQEGIEFYREKGFKTIVFKGLKPTSFEEDETTLIYKDGNCLGI